MGRGLLPYPIAHELLEKVGGPGGEEVGAGEAAQVGFVAEPPEDEGELCAGVAGGFPVYLGVADVDGFGGLHAHLFQCFQHGIKYGVRRDWLSC